jgi:DNA-binding MarR family transcriptional regulator
MASQAACAELTNALPALGEIKRMIQRRLPSGQVSAIPILGALALAGDQRASTLAERLHLDLSVVSRQVSGLLDAGLIERHQDPDDGRAHRLSLTPAGTAVLERFTAGLTDVFGRALDGWDDSDVLALARLLRRFADAVGNADADQLGRTEALA